MSRFDDRLTRELERVARPAETTDVFDEIDRRRGRRAAVRRVQTALLATVVFAGSIGGVLVLNRAFRGEGGTAPAISPGQNGLIVVSFGDDGGTHLYLQNPDDPSWDPREHQLTKGPGMYDTHPAISPDGKTVVFLRVDQPNFTHSLWTVGIDGSGPHELTPGGFLGVAFSPDGTTIATDGAGDEGGLFLLDPDGSNVRKVPNTDSQMQDVAWSPDGIRLAFIGGGIQYDVGVIDVDGSGRTELPGTGSDTPTQPTWSPDGSTIAFVKNEDIWLFDLASQTTRQLTTYPQRLSTDDFAGDGAPTWSPDGRFLAFERYVSPREQFLYVVRPSGTELRRIGPGGTPAWSVAQPDTSPNEATPTDTASPVDQTPGRDIGLGFNLCRLEALNGIDFLGDGANGTAWVGTRLAENGSCPPLYEGESIVAVDVEGDGSAESWAGPLARCVACSPFDVTDLNADGVLELVVTLQYSSITEYTLFSLQPVPGDGPPELRQVTVAEPGLPPNFRAGKPVSLWAGGDAGIGDYIRCEGYPAQPVLIATESFNPIDGPQTSQVDVARLALRADGTIEVIGSDSFTDPGTTDPPSYAFTGKACGVNFRPFG